MLNLLQQRIVVGYPVTIYSTSQSAQRRVSHSRLVQMVASQCWLRSADAVALIKSIGLTLSDLLSADETSDYTSKCSTATEIFSGVMRSVVLAHREAAEGTRRLRRGVGCHGAHTYHFNEDSFQRNCKRLGRSCSFCMLARSCGGYKPLLPHIVRELSAALGDSSEFSMAYKYLMLTKSIIAEVCRGADLAAVASQPVPILIPAFASPFEVVRNEIGHVMGRLTVKHFGSPIEDRLWIADAVDKILKMSTPPDGETENEATNVEKSGTLKPWERSSQSCTSLIDLWLHASGTRFGEYLLKLMPVVLRLQGHSDKELARHGTGTLLMIACGVLFWMGPSNEDKSPITALMDVLSEHGIKASEWHRRVAAITCAAPIFVQHFDTWQLRMPEGKKDSHDCVDGRTAAS